jgi:hypothetical protein
MRKTTDLQRRGGRAQDQIELAIDQMENRVLNKTRELRMTELVRRAARNAAAAAGRSRRYLFLERHTPTQQRFLRMMVELAFATDPSLQTRGRQVAKYYSRNYAFEWMVNPVTAPARELARDTILRAGDSEYGETPLAGPMAYVMFHHDEIGVANVAAYSDVYTRTLQLERMGFFRERQQGLRQRLHLPSYAESASLMTPTPAAKHD